MKLSIILPAYNCAAFVREAADSVLAVQRADLELIAVDDGSADGTRAVLDALAEADSRVRVFTIPNGGPANARNYGLSQASGDFVGFLDADDVFRADALEEQAGRDPACDVLICGFIQTFDGRAEPKLYLPEGADPASLLRRNMLNSVWNKFYRRSFLTTNQITFPDCRWGEDRLFNFACLRAGARVEVSPEVLYEYRMDGGVSLVSGYLPDKPEICARVYRESRQICRDETLTAQLYLKSLLSCCTVLFAGNCPLSRREKLDYIRRLKYLPETRQATTIPQSGYYGVIRRLFRLGVPRRIYAFARTVALTQRNFLPVFLRFRR